VIVGIVGPHQVVVRFWCEAINPPLSEHGFNRFGCAEHEIDPSSWVGPHLLLPEMLGWMRDAPCHLALKDFGIVESVGIECGLAIPRVIEAGWVRAMNDLVAESCDQIRGVKFFVVIERGDSILESRAVKLFHCALFYLPAAS